MRRLGRRELDLYLSNDWVGKLLRQCTQDGDENLTCQHWLAKSPAKRLIFAEMYGDLLESKGLRILDVGGGLTSLTRIFSHSHYYVLIDFMAHDSADIVETFLSGSSGDFSVHQIDWSEVDLTGPFDVVLANDLFPNVDQRLSLFLDKILPICREVRLSLTYFNESRTYRAKRVDADEVLTVLAWTGPMTRLALAPYAGRVYKPDMNALVTNDDSIFPNRRHICLVTLRGDLAGI